MSKNGNPRNSVNTKDLTQLLEESQDTVPMDNPGKFLRKENLSLRSLIMANAFAVMFTKTFNDHGNATIMMRKQQIAVCEIENIIALTKIVGDCFDALEKPSDSND